MILTRPPSPLSTQALHWDRGRPARTERHKREHDPYPPPVSAFHSSSSLGPRASRPHGAPQARTRSLPALRLRFPLKLFTGTAGVPPARSATGANKFFCNNSKPWIHRPTYPKTKTISTINHLSCDEKGKTLFAPAALRAGGTPAVPVKSLN